jgi:MFS family permease
MLSVYAVTMNLNVLEISILLFSVTLAGALFQWPIGSLSDNYDRRIVIIGCCIASSTFAILSIMASGISFENLFVEEMFRFNYFSTETSMDKTKLFIYIILLSGMTLPLFALNLALVNDYIPKEKFVAAGAGLNMIFGLGAIAGPIVCSVLMSIFGPNGFFIHLLIFFMVIIIFGVFRMNRRKYEDNPESTFTPLPKDITPLGIELDPDTGVDLSNTSNDKK